MSKCYIKSLSEQMYTCCIAVARTNLLRRYQTVVIIMLICDYDWIHLAKIHNTISKYFCSLKDKPNAYVMTTEQKNYVSQPASLTLKKRNGIDWKLRSHRWFLGLVRDTQTHAQEHNSSMMQHFMHAKNYEHKLQIEMPS